MNCSGGTNCAVSLVTSAGTLDAYKLTSEMATTEEYAETYKYAHSLFVADYAVTYAASWDHLNAIDMIFGKDYAAGGVDYTLRAPSEGCRTDFADIQNKKECGGNRQWQRRFLRTWAANTKGKAII